MVAASQGGSADETIGAICGTLAAFTGGAEPADDVTVVVVRRGGRLVDVLDGARWDEIQIAIIIIAVHRTHPYRCARIRVGLTIPCCAVLAA